MAASGRPLEATAVIGAAAMMADEEGRVVLVVDAAFSEDFASAGADRRHIDTTTLVREILMFRN